MGPDVLIRDGDCHSWDDGKSFSTFRYSWEFHYLEKSGPEKYGDCKIFLLEESSCGGRVVASFGKANTEAMYGGCFSEHDPPGWAGPAKSVLLQCDKPDPVR